MCHWASESIYLCRRVPPRRVKDTRAYDHSFLCECSLGCDKMNDLVICIFWWMRLEALRAFKSDSRNLDKSNDLRNRLGPSLRAVSNSIQISHRVGQPDLRPPILSTWVGRMPIITQSERALVRVQADAIGSRIYAGKHLWWRQRKGLAFEYWM